MPQRRFGPTLGAGVVVIEKDAEKLVDPAPLGVTLYVTPLERGETGKLISCFSKRDMLRKVGGLIQGFDGPDCAQDFWDHSNGAGELHFLRVARSTLRKAVLDLYSREATDPPSDLVGGKSRAVMRVTAKSGGRWAGRKRIFYRATTLLGDIGTTTLTTGLTMLQDEWSDGYVVLDGVPSKRYAITANSTAGVVSVSPDSNMSADLAAGAAPTNQRYQLILETRIGPEGLKRALAVEIGDGEQNPSTEFSLRIFINEEQITVYPDLSMDPASPRYFVRIINDDPGNFDIEVSDLLSPSNPTPTDRRPANESGLVSAVTSTVLTSKLFGVRRTVGASNPAIALGTTTDAMKYRDTFEFEVTDVSAGNATISMKSMRVGNGISVHAAVVAANTAATVFTFATMTSPLAPPMTVTVGSTVFTVGDKFQVDYFPFEPSALIGGYLVPDFINKPRSRFRIVANDHKTITVQSGDLVVDGGSAANDRFMVIYPQQLGGSDLTGGVAANGYDGLAGLADSDYNDVLLNSGTSPALSLLSENKGLVKVATPDRTATSVSKAGLNFAEALNWQYRVEIPDNIVTEDLAVAHINDTIGRNDFGVTVFPSYADVPDLERPGQLKRIPLTGMIHGREALVARTFDGYHKAAAGTDVKLPRITKLPFDRPMNEEVLNPKGINIVKKIKGNFVIWGDRSIALDTAWKFKHHRELFSHYENRIREGFDFIIFALNDPTTQQILIAAFQEFFRPEFAKGAIRGKDLADAARIKIDSENNTNATRASGELFADLDIQPADTVERFIVRVGKRGIFEQTSA